MAKPDDMPRVWLRDVGTTEDPCWVPCAKGDHGAVQFEPTDHYKNLFL